VRFAFPWGQSLSQIFLQIDKAVVERREYILRANRESIYCGLVQRESPSSGPDVFTQASEVVRASAENLTPAVFRKCNALSAVQVCSLRGIGKLGMPERWHSHGYRWCQGGRRRSINNCWRWLGGDQMRSPARSAVQSQSCEAARISITSRRDW